METGIELIAKERQEQIEKHGWLSGHDELHDDRQLATAAMYAIECRMVDCQCGFENFEERVCQKPYKERLIIAGALIAAEIDRLNALK
jgi:hypothetical protein